MSKEEIQTPDLNVFKPNSKNTLITTDEFFELWNKRNDYDKLQQEKENLIKYLEDKINMYDGYIDTAKSDLEKIKYTLFAYNNMKQLIEENIKAKNIFQDILERVKSGKYE